MPLDPATVLVLATACAPNVAPATLLAVARAESGLDPLAIGQNGPPIRIPAPRSADEAAARAGALIGAGHDLDLGLAQINVRNLARLGLSVRDAFDPCRNLAAAAAVLADGYRRGAAQVGPGQAALRIALSYYNTGHPARGFRNGYVARVAGQASRSPRPAEPPSAPPPAPPPGWDVFARARPGAPVLPLAPTGALP